MLELSKVLGVKGALKIHFPLRTGLVVRLLGDRDRAFDNSFVILEFEFRVKFLVVFSLGHHMEQMLVSNPDCLEDLFVSLVHLEQSAFALLDDRLTLSLLHLKNLK